MLERYKATYRRKPENNRGFDVRCSEKSRKYLLASSFSACDPERTYVPLQGLQYVCENSSLHHAAHNSFELSAEDNFLAG